MSILWGFSWRRHRLLRQERGRMGLVGLQARGG